MRGGRIFLGRMGLSILFRKDSVFPDQNIYHNSGNAKWDYIPSGFAKSNSLLSPILF